MPQTIYQVDAFTSQSYTGNPAGVCLLTAPADEVWMQNVAREMNLSETAFLHPEEDGFRLRWFTPAAEVELCGHATLASAHTLYETGKLLPGEQARFHTLSGLLTAQRAGDWIELDFPSTPEHPVTPPADAAEVLGAEPVYVGQNVYDYLIELGSESEVRNLNPNLARLEKWPVRGVIVTSRSDSPEFDFVSRFFAPQVGVPEDPVTGSAHCCLGPFWAERLGKQQFVAYQASARGGVLRVRLQGSRVRLGGQAVTTLQGELFY